MVARPIPVALFIENLQLWRTAFEERRFDDARMHADEIAYLGRVLTADPEFQRILERHRTSQSATGDDAVGAVCAFFRAITDTALPGEYRTDGQAS